MGRAKEIIVKVIPTKIANAFIKKVHYSGKVVTNSNLHFGCFLDKQLHGVMSYGPPLDKNKVLPTVKYTGWNEMIELNRMAFDSYLPKYSESRCIAISIKLIKKNAPQIKWILSFSDGTQCGDGTIYRASGFKLIGIKENYNLCKLPNGSTMHLMGLQGGIYGKHRKHMLKKGYTSGRKYMTEVLKGVQIKGYQLKYIYFIDKKMESNLTKPIIPFSEIDKQGAGMYKGKKMTIAERK